MTRGYVPLTKIPFLFCNLSHNTWVFLQFTINIIWEWCEIVPHWHSHYFISNFLIKIVGSHLGKENQYGYISCEHV